MYILYTCRRIKIILTENQQRPKIECDLAVMEKEIPHEVDAHESAAPAHHNAEALHHTSEMRHNFLIMENIVRKPRNCRKFICRAGPNIRRLVFSTGVMVPVMFDA